MDPSPSSTPAAAAPAAGGEGAPGNLLSGAGQQSAAAAASAAVAGNGQPWTWAAEDGKFNEGWVDKLGDEFKSGSSTLSTIPDVKTLAKAYLDTKKLVGSKLSPPGSDATPDQIAAWRKTVGAPEKPEDYGSLMPEGFQKEMWDAGMEKEFTVLAHKHHLPVAVVKDIVGLHAKGTQGIYAREVEAAKAALEKGRGDLKTAWGQDFDRRAAEATAMAAALGIDPTDDIFVSRPDILQKLAAAAPTMLGGDKIIAGMPVSVSGGIQDRINTVRSGDDYQGKNGDARQKAAAEQMRQLYAALEKTKAA